MNVDANEVLEEVKAQRNAAWDEVAMLRAALKQMISENGSNDDTAELS